MLTAKDIDLMKQFFMTKEDFEDERRELRNEIQNFEDHVITEIRELRQETDVNSSFRSKIDKQDKRLDRLETAVFN